MSAKKGFNLKDLLNDNSRGAKLEKSNKVETKGFEVKEIDIENIIPSKENFYNVKDIEKIKQSIELLGIEQNLIVEKLDDNNYKLLAGHRRYFASKELVMEGKEKHKKLPCRVKEVEDDVLNKLTMIMTNSTARELSDWEKLHQTLEIEELVIQLKKDMGLPGRTRDLLSQIISTSPAQLGRYKAIKNNLIDELMEEFKDGNIPFTVAYKASGLSESLQKVLLDILNKEGDLTLLDVEAIKTKEEATRPLPGQLNIDNIEDYSESEHEEVQEEKKDEELQGDLIQEKREGKIEGKILDESNESYMDHKQEPETHIQIIETKEYSTNKNNGCAFCNKEINTTFPTVEGGMTINYDFELNKMAITNNETGEVQHISIANCPLCGRSL